MKFHVLTIFPDFFTGPFSHGVVAKARSAGKLDIHIHDLRNWTHDRHRTVDDRPFGGGAGMVMKPEPIFAAVEEILNLPPRHPNPEHQPARPRQRIILLTPQGQLFHQAKARELAAAIVLDATARLLPGVLGNDDSAAAESFENEGFDYPHWTRPADFRGWQVPEVLLQGHHAEIANWRKRTAEAKTGRNRPDLGNERNEPK